MAGMRVVVVATRANGNIDVDDLRAKAAEHATRLAALMVTYPSTHGVFEDGIQEICAIVHEHGGQVYMDGANMNAQVGLTSPAADRRRRLPPEPAQDVRHSARRRRARAWGRSAWPRTSRRSCPGIRSSRPAASRRFTPVAAAPWGSASILLISYGYIAMLGARRHDRRDALRAS